MLLDISSSNSSKNTILFTSSHHAREAISFSMITTIFLKKLKDLISLEKSENIDFWDTNKILFLPVVNVDSVILINQNFEKYKMLRKNRNPFSCKSPMKESSYGVDVNRNYDIAFSSKADEETKENCTEVFGGDKPFAEPETKAVKSLFENYNYSIISAMNFHSYGNLWIRPFNFLTVKSKMLVNESKYEKSKPNFKMETFEKLYDHFTVKAPIPPGGIVANAIRAVDYPAPGEASDWMLWHKGVFAWSPELGYGSNGIDGKWGESDKFYPTKDVQKKIFVKDFPVIEWFLEEHSIRILKFLVRDEDGFVVIGFEIIGFGDLQYADFELEFVGKKDTEKEVFLKMKKIFFEEVLENQENILKDEKRKEKELNVNFVVKCLKRMEETTIKLKKTKEMITLLNQKSLQFSLKKNEKMVLNSNLTIGLNGEIKTIPEMQEGVELKHLLVICAIVLFLSILSCLLAQCFFKRIASTVEEQEFGELNLSKSSIEIQDLEDNNR